MNEFLFLNFEVLISFIPILTTSFRGSLFRRSLKERSVYFHNHNYNKILISDWLSTALISALIGQFNRTVRVMPK